MCTSFSFQQLYFEILHDFFFQNFTIFLYICSAERVKPEKELQRASSEILRRKLEVRDLFQRLDTICAEGKLQDSLFDSEGQIDSEDVCEVFIIL